MTQNSGNIFTNNTHVLLVDNDIEYLASTARVLRLFQYKVTTAESEHEATALVDFYGNDTFDLVLMNPYLPSVVDFNLMREVIAKRIPTILVSGHVNASDVTSALQCGATMFLEKPINVEVLKTLWQYVMKDKMIKEKIIALEAATGGATKSEAKEQMNGAASTAENKRKSYVRWTGERHMKFVTAVLKLGQDNCYPKDILELMDEPNLNRLQVASHLQKCRWGKWLGPKTTKNYIGTCPNNNDGVIKYGKMPDLELLRIPQELRKEESQEAGDTDEPPFIGINFGEYPFEKFSPNFGVDELSVMNDILDISKMPDLEPFNSGSVQNNFQLGDSGSVEENFQMESNLNFSYQPQGGRGV